MRVAVGLDHAGFPLKAVLLAELARLGHDALDLGTDSEAPVDYPDYALAVAEAIRVGAAEVGVRLCGSGVGACVAANKAPGIRAALCHDTYSAHQSREHDDANVLVMGPRVIGPSLARDVLETFLAARFSGEARHLRRLAKIAAIEARFAPTVPSSGKEPDACSVE
jgi:ribose 5-phosphate isomerase B